MPFNIIRNDIIKMNVDAIVNAANTDLQAGGGVSGAIFEAAGVRELQKACDKLAPINIGDAVVTKGYSLSAKYIIHTAGPFYIDGNHDEESLLRSCYENSLDIAKKNKCKSIAFPLISSGIYGYPKDEALKVATDVIGEWLMASDMDVSLVVFDKEAFALSSGLLGDVKAFISQNYVDKNDFQFARSRPMLRDGFESFESEALPPVPKSQVDYKTQVLDFDTQVDGTSQPLESETQDANIIQASKSEAQVNDTAQAFSSNEFFDNISYSTPAAAKYKPSRNNIKIELDESFTATLLKMIDSKGKSDVEVYKRANLDRKLFSKIRKGKGYMPSKKTVVALAVALELTMPETQNLLRRAGFILSRSVVFDVIIEYFITNKKYDIFDINNVLFEYDQPLLGG